MSPWSTYPTNYRSKEVQTITRAIRAGECVFLVGLSGSGKSNLLGYLAYQSSQSPAFPRMQLVDCNRLTELSAEGLYRIVRLSFGKHEPASDEFSSIEELIGQQIDLNTRLCLLLDRFEILVDLHQNPAHLPGSASIFGNLRALRDRYKYSLTYVIASRRPLDPNNELAELFYANTLWLGPLGKSDAIWNVESYAQRKGLQWDDAITREILDISGGYPSFLRAVCEAVSAGAPANLENLSGHPSIRSRIDEFWADHPDRDDLRNSGLSDHPLLATSRPMQYLESDHLTPKEQLLWEYLTSRPDEVCEKDDLIRAVWPEDRIYTQGVRDDSLAQLVRRLREKIEPDPSKPAYIQTIPGRGYRFNPG